MPVYTSAPHRFNMIIYFTANSIKQIRDLYFCGIKHIAVNFTTVTRQRERIPVLKFIKKYSKINWMLYANEMTPEYSGWLLEGVFDYVYDFSDETYTYIIKPGNEEERYALIPKGVKKTDLDEVIAKTKMKSNKVAFWGGKHLERMLNFYLLHEWISADRYGDVNIFVPETSMWRYIKSTDVVDELQIFKGFLDTNGYDYKSLLKGNRNERIRLTVESWNNYAGRMKAVSETSPVLSTESAMTVTGDVVKEYGIIPSGMRVWCSTCSLAGRCPKYEEGKLCKMEPEFAHFQDKSVDGCIDSLTALVEESMVRIRRARAMEDQMGMASSEKITKQLSATIKHVQALQKAIESKQGITPPGGGDGILAKLFGVNAPEEKSKVIDAEPVKKGDEK